jgi:hypothetical protein
VVCDLSNHCYLIGGRLNKPKLSGKKSVRKNKVVQEKKSAPSSTDLDMDMDDCEFRTLANGCRVALIVWFVVRWSLQTGSRLAKVLTLES